MLYRDRIFLISLSLLSSLGYAGDTPQSPHTVEMVNKNPSNSPQMPKVEFQQPHATGGGGNGSSSSGVGSNAGGSIINAALALVGPSQKELERDREIELLNQQLSKAMTKDLRGPIVGIPRPDEYYIKDPSAVTGFAVSSPSTFSAPVVTTPTPAPAVIAAPPAAIVGKSPFVILNRDKVPTLNEMTPPLSYTKPAPTPQPIDSIPSSTYAPAPTPSDSLEWGQMIKDAGEGAAIAVAAVAVVYVGYKTGEGLYKGSKWLWKKAFGEAEKQVVQQVVPKSVHANLEFHQNPGHCTSTKGKSKGGCLRAEVQPGDPRTRGLADIEFPADATHIFRDQWGHFVHDNPETRSLLRDCYKKGTYHGFDGSGNHQFSMTNPKDGTQLWVKIREGGRISTAGCNELHLPISKETGFLFKPDCWTNPSAKGVGCTFLGGLLPTMSSQVAKANIPEAVLFPVDQDPNVGDLNFFPFNFFPEHCETYRHRYRSDFIQQFGMPTAPEGYYFEPVKNEGLLLPPPPIAVTAEEVKAERASKMSYAIRMKKKNMEDYVIMEEMRRRNKQEAKVLKNAFFKKDSL